MNKEEMEELAKFWGIINDSLYSLDAFIVNESKTNKASISKVRKSVKKSIAIAKQNRNTVKKALLDLESEELKNWR